MTSEYDAAGDQQFNRRARSPRWPSRLLYCQASSRLPLKRFDQPANVRLDDDLDQFIASGKLKDEELAKAVFKSLDSDGNGALVVPEYLRVWGRWARIGRKTQAAGSK